MTPREAELKLRESKKRRKGARGPAGLGFTLVEKLAVRVMTHHRRSQAQIADMAGLSLRSYTRALEKDTDLAFMQQLGRDDRLLDHVEKLERIAKKDAHRGQMKSIELLLKLDRQIGEARDRASNDINININAGSVAAQIDGRKFTAALDRLQKNQPPPQVIEGQAQEVNPVELDPIAAVKRRQRQEREER